MRYYAFFVAGWLLLAGCAGIVRSRSLVHAVASLSVCQCGTYVLLIAVGFQWRALAPVFSSTFHPTTHVVDPVVQAMCLTDIVVGATVTAMLLAMSIQVGKQHHTVDPDELTRLQG